MLKIKPTLIITLLLLVTFLSCKKKPDHGRFVSEKQWKIDSTVITENIYDKGGFPDHTYNKRYSLKRPDGTIVTTDHNDDNRNQSKPPFTVNDNFIIRSGTMTALITPDNKCYPFSVFSAQNWEHFADSLNLTWYHYHIDTVLYRDSVWRILYRPAPGTRLDIRPYFISFTSHDNWQTITVD